MYASLSTTIGPGASIASPVRSPHTSLSCSTVPEASQPMPSLPISQACALSSLQSLPNIPTHLMPLLPMSSDNGALGLASGCGKRGCLPDGRRCKARSPW
ncbi:hypothetical protein PTTG_06069, partial [Puccinia triticina 1-1 BBBD Race 1]